MLRMLTKWKVDVQSTSPLVLQVAYRKERRLRATNRTVSQLKTILNDLNEVGYSRKDTPGMKKAQLVGALAGEGEADSPAADITTAAATAAATGAGAATVSTGAAAVAAATSPSVGQQQRPAGRGASACVCPLPPPTHPRAVHSRTHRTCVRAHFMPTS